VFRNDPVDVAGWWKELLEDEGYRRFFDTIVFAVLDCSKTHSNISVPCLKLCFQIDLDNVELAIHL